MILYSLTLTSALSLLRLLTRDCRQVILAWFAQWSVWLRYVNLRSRSTPKYFVSPFQRTGRSKIFTTPWGRVLCFRISTAVSFSKLTSIRYFKNHASSLSAAVSRRLVTTPCYHKLGHTAVSSTYRTKLVPSIFDMSLVNSENREAITVNSEGLPLSIPRSDEPRYHSEFSSL